MSTNRTTIVAAGRVKLPSLTSAKRISDAYAPAPFASRRHGIKDEALPEAPLQRLGFVRPGRPRNALPALPPLQRQGLDESHTKASRHKERAAAPGGAASRHRVPAHSAARVKVAAPSSGAAIVTELVATRKTQVTDLVIADKALLTEEEKEQLRYFEEVRQKKRAQQQATAVPAPPVLASTVSAPPVPAPKEKASREIIYPTHPSGIGSLPAASTSAYSQVRPIAQLADRYDCDDSRPLGAGANGSVRTITKRATGEVYALKAMPTDPDATDSETAISLLLADVEMQRSLDHPNIARVLDVYLQDSSAESREYSGEVSFVMPFYSGGSLAQYMKRHPHVDDAKTATLMHKMLRALHSCHTHGIMHRDVKLENFVFDSEDEEAELKLIDFGMAARVTPQTESQSEGFTTLWYTAPEMHFEYHRVLQKTGRVPGNQDVSYTSAIDVWALGLIAYQLLCGRFPFGIGEDPNEDEEIVVDRIAFEPLTFPQCSPPLSSEAVDFCNWLLERDPSKRPNAAMAMGHPWILQGSTLHKRAAPTAKPSPAGNVAAKVGGKAAAKLGMGARVDARKQLLQSLGAFVQSSPLRRYACHALAYSTPSTAPHLRELRRAFVAADLDESGTLCRAEFHQALSWLHPPPLPIRLDADRLFGLLDVAKTGQIEWRWFLAAMQGSAPLIASAPLPTTRELIDAFHLLDRDGDGYIGVSDLASLFASSAEASVRLLDSTQLSKILRQAIGPVKPKA
uniref:Non-specific serine/threonine protein kinase n=1 Tax=Haptolina brevifila TaxID=156173 RepID=A0A7S2DN41_9EUKA|mmetsp:Transcript_41427/g.83056  ORF Transcript_41427/g.83056 Transcript_41427/m.83056 type:complete len:740 (+) Transcript_41427:59-2278(+)